MNGSPPKPPIRILLADDHRIMREALRDLLELEPDIRIIQEVADGQSAVEKTLELVPDIACLDIRMQKINGIDATRQIKQARPEVHVICISMHYEKKFREAAFQAGASGYLAKSEAVKDLMAAIRAVLAGEKYDGR
jgi:two-component system response regulator NreC